MFDSHAAFFNSMVKWHQTQCLCISATDICSIEDRKSYRYRTTWGWVDDRMSVCQRYCNNFPSFQSSSAKNIHKCFSVPCALKIIGFLDIRWITSQKPSFECKTTPSTRVDHFHLCWKVTESQRLKIPAVLNWDRQMKQTNQKVNKATLGKAAGITDS